MLGAGAVRTGARVMHAGGRSAAGAFAAAWLVPRRRHRLPGGQCDDDRGGDLARPAGADGRIQIEFVVAGGRRAPDLPRARDQARTSGRRSSRLMCLPDRWSREAHRNRAGLDRDARRKRQPKSQARPDEAGLEQSQSTSSEARVTCRWPALPAAPRRRGWASGSKNSPAAASASAAASWSS